MLIDYAAALGLRPFAADYYAPDRTAIMIDHTVPPVEGSGEMARPTRPYTADAPTGGASSGGVGVVRRWLGRGSGA